MKSENIELNGVFVQSPLLPPVFKFVGVGIAILGAIAATMSWFEVPVLTPWLLSVGWKCSLLLGLTAIAMSRETKEDEVVGRLRLEVAQWAVWLLSLIAIVNIVISDDNPIEAYKILILVLFGAIVLFHIRLFSFGRHQ